MSIILRLYNKTKASKTLVIMPGRGFYLFMLNKGIYKNYDSSFLKTTESLLMLNFYCISNEC